MSYGPPATINHRARVRRRAGLPLPGRGPCPLDPETERHLALDRVLSELLEHNTAGARARRRIHAAARGHGTGVILYQPPHVSWHASPTVAATYALTRPGAPFLIVRIGG